MAAAVMTGGVDDQVQLLEHVVGRFRGASSPVLVIVFGSMATGTATAESDLDLLVLLDDVADTRQESIRLRDALGDIEMPIDVIVMSTARFEETKHVIGGIACPAHKYGRVIYEAA